MRNAGRQMSDGFHFLGMAQLKFHAFVVLFCMFLFGHIRDNKRVTFYVELIAEDGAASEQRWDFFSFRAFKG